MNRDQILRRNDEITAETDAVIRRGKEIVSKLESGAIKPDDPQVKEVLQQLIERRRIGTLRNSAYTPRMPQPSIRAAGLVVGVYCVQNTQRLHKG